MGSPHLMEGGAGPRLSEPLTPSFHWPPRVRNRGQEGSRDSLVVTKLEVAEPRFEPGAVSLQSHS